VGGVRRELANCSPKMSLTLTDFIYSVNTVRRANDSSPQFAGGEFAANSFWRTIVRQKRSFAETSNITFNFLANDSSPAASSRSVRREQFLANDCSPKNDRSPKHRILPLIFLANYRSPRPRRAIICTLQMVFCRKWFFAPNSRLLPTIHFTIKQSTAFSFRLKSTGTLAH